MKRKNIDSLAFSVVAICALLLFSACKDPGILAWEGVWEVKSLTSGGNTTSYPISLFLQLDPDDNTSDDIDSDGEDEDVLIRVYYRFSNGKQRSYLRYEYSDPGETAEAGDWGVLVPAEGISYDSSEDAEYSQLGTFITLKEAGENEEDLSGTFSYSGDTLVFSSDDGSLSFTLSEVKESVIKDATDTASP